MKSFGKKWIVFGLLACTAGSVFTFQNCSQAKFSPTADAASFYPAEVGAQRSISLNPQYSQASSTNPIKVLLIVDDSDTMSNSQQNLARNMTNLLESIKTYDASIMVLTTSYYAMVNNKFNQVQLTNGESTYTTTRRFNAQIPKFTLTKSMSTEQRNNSIKTISDYVKALGTTGSDYETPLAVLSLALDNDTKFFTQGDTALIYFITDENDSDSTSYLLTPKYDYSRFAATSYTFDIVPGYKISYRYLYVSLQQEVPRYGESGNVVGTQILDLPSINMTDPTECATRAASYTAPFKAKCEAGTYSDLTGPLYGQSIEDYCTKLSISLGTKLISCIGVDVSEPHYSGGSLLEMQQTYFLDLVEGLYKPLDQTAREKFMFNLLKTKMESYFGSRYLVSAQVNLAGQSSCHLIGAQSLDKAFTNFGKLFTGTNFNISSICDTKGVNGDALKEISTKFQTILETKYLVSLSPNERIISAVLFKNGQKTDLLENVDFKLDGNNFQLLKPSLEGFDRIDLGIKAF